MATADFLVFNFASFVAGLFLLEYGADKFIDHTAVVAKQLNVSPTLVGLLTCGAEWEELVVIAVAVGQKDSKMALGNLLGSSIANVLASFSLGLLFMREVTFDRSSRIYGLVLFGLTTIFLLFLLTLNVATKWVAGVLLVLAFVVYIGSVSSLIYQGTLTAPEDSSDSESDSDESQSDSDSAEESHSHVNIDHLLKVKDKIGTLGHEKDVEEQRQRSTNLSERNHYGILLKRISRQVKTDHRRMTLQVKKPPKPLRHHISRLLVGLAALLLSSYIVARSAATLGRALGLSGTVVGTTILSLATTLPEKFVAVMGGVRRQPGIMVANTVGSNIFLVTLCAGVMFLGGDIDQLRSAMPIFEAAVMWLATTVILAVIVLGGRRWMGVLMLVCYVAFLVTELLTGRQLDDD